MRVNYKRPYLYPKQESAIFYPWDCDGNPARFSLIEASTKSGKTVGCIAWIFERALLNGKPGYNYWWIAPWFRTAEIAFDRTQQFFPHGSYEANKSDKTIIVPSGARIWFKSAEKPDALYGEDVYDAVVDEASRMRHEAWIALRSTLTATRGCARIIGNVKGKKNWFYLMARRAEKGEPGLSWHKIISRDAITAGVLDGDEVEMARRDMPERVFQELYEAEAADDGGNPFGIDNIRRCIAPLSGDEPTAWGWDLAKHVNWTVGIGLDRAGRTAGFARFRKPWKETLDEIRRITDGKPALVDSTGVGDPIVEFLQRDLGSNFEGYHFTGPSKQKLMEGLAVAIQSGPEAITYPEGVITNELETFEYQYTRTGVIYSAPEGADDDCVMSLALAKMKHVANDDLRDWEAMAS